ncbi:MAG: oligopeptide transporter permease protein [Symbiobacteriaceae bacterium]|jgi:peptide/nickel transport system permease protein|nr:oligopeptide transporter permease protein [Symbiobacteriaceae bacterium]
MLVYVTRRLLAGIPVLIGVSLITFILMHIVPGDPVTAAMDKRADAATIARLRKEMGLDRPLVVQYFEFVGKAAIGDLGTSFRSKRPVGETIIEALPMTARVAGSAMAVALLIGIPFGTLAALRKNSFIDYMSTVTTLSFISAPVFWVALLAQLLFGLQLRWLPISGYQGPVYLILPALVLGTRYAASIARYTRASMLEVLNQDFVRTARAKGVAERFVIWKHALKNALVPLLTVIGLEIGGLMTGSILTESVFGIPGVGRITIQAIQYRDFPMIEGTVLFTAVVFVVTNLLVDISYSLVDPRIRMA